MMFNPLQPDAFTMYVMQSNEYKDKIIKEATRYMQRGASVQGAVKMAMLTNHIDESDLTDPDITDINDFIEENM